MNKWIIKTRIPFITNSGDLISESRKLIKNVFENSESRLDFKTQIYNQLHVWRKHGIIKDFLMSGCLGPGRRGLLQISTKHHNNVINLDFEWKNYAQ